jgi:hypothetical protein
MPGPTPARHRAGHQVVTTLTVERVPTPITAGRRRLTCRGGLIPSCMIAGESPPLPFLLLAHALCSPSSIACFAIADHHHALPWLSKAAEASTSTSTSVDIDREPKPMATQSAKAPLLAASSSARGHHRPSPLVHLQPSQRFEENRTSLLPLLDSISTAGDQPSVPPPVIFICPSPPPSGARSGEPLPV